MGNEINIYIINGEAIHSDDPEEEKRLAKEIEKVVDQYHTRKDATIPKLTVKDKVHMFILQNPTTWRDIGYRAIAAKLGCGKSSVGSAVKELIEEGLIR